MTFIKICANTNLADAQLAAELGADAVGFVFAPSKRQVTVDQVAAITPHLPGSVAKVGVFAASDPREIAAAVRTAGLTGVQLHHAPDIDLIEELNCALEGHAQIIQVVPYPVDAADRADADKEFEAQIETALAVPAVTAILLDAARSGVAGGLGISFDWEHAAAIVKRAYKAAASEGRDLPKLIVAGGLRAENVAEAIAMLEPWGVDVASGVESKPGKKDPEKLRAFFDAVRQGSAAPGK
jgi:phosphoribosylanthranilate isomerase